LRTGPDPALPAGGRRLQYGFSSPLALQTDHTNSVRQQVVECCCSLWALPVCYRHNHTNSTPGTSSSITCEHPTFCCLVTSLFRNANVVASVKSIAFFFVHSHTVHPDIIKFFIYPFECTTRLF